MADKPGVPEQLGQRGEEARRRQFQCLAVEMALRRMADENRILRTGQADKRRSSASASGSIAPPGSP